MLMINDVCMSYMNFEGKKKKKTQEVEYYF